MALRKKLMDESEKERQLMASLGINTLFGVLIELNCTLTADSQISVSSSDPLELLKAVFGAGRTKTKNINDLLAGPLNDRRHVAAVLPRSEEVLDREVYRTVHRSRSQGCSYYTIDRGKK